MQEYLENVLTLEFDNFLTTTRVSISFGTNNIPLLLPAFYLWTKEENFANKQSCCIYAFVFSTLKRA